jgi:hypothetical protein
MLHVFRNLLLIVPLLMGLHAGVPAGGVTVQDDAVTLNFPDTVTFSLRAEDPAGITGVKLIYGTNAQLCLTGDGTHDFVIDPGTQVAATWDWDLNRSGNLPPGVEIHWQWEITDKSGATQLTEPKKEVIADPNYTWNKLEKGSIRLLYAKGGDSFGQLLLDTARNSLKTITNRIGVEAPQAITLVVYPSAEDLRKATLHMPDWIGGVAFPEYDIVLMAIGPSETGWATSVIPHELTHLIVDRRITNCQGAYLPTWLNEGLAVASEGPATGQETQQVMKALKNNTIEPLTMLEGGFAADSDLANQEYAQSGIVTRWILDTYGAKKMDALMGSVQQGDLIDDALHAVYGMDTNGVDEAWRASLGFKTTLIDPHTEATMAHTPIPTLALQSPLSGVRTATAQPSPSSAPAAQTTATSAPQPTQSETTLPAATSAGAVGNLSIVLLLICGCGGLVLVLAAIAVFLIFRFKKRENIQP